MRLVPERRALNAALLLALVLAAGGCAAPTLPLPPPTALVEAPDADGMVTVTGSAIENAFVFCLDEDQNRGVIVRSDSSGHFTLQIAGSSGETLRIWLQKDSTVSEVTEQLVPGTPSGDGGMPPDAGSGAPDGG